MNRDQISEAALQHLRDREGSVNMIYKDSLDKPTGGTGHLMRPQDYLDLGLDMETLQYGAYDHPDYGEMQVALDSNGNPIQLDESVTNNWLSNDSQTAFNAANYQMSQLGEEYQNNEGLRDSLINVNYQMGENWYKPSSEGGKGFTGVWEGMLEGDWEKAAGNVEWQNPATKLNNTGWHNQTPKRTNDFMEGLRAMNTPSAEMATLDPFGYGTEMEEADSYDPSNVAYGYYPGRFKD